MVDLPPDDDQGMTIVPVDNHLSMTHDPSKLQYVATPGRKVSAARWEEQTLNVY
jgi:hypothetical protein